MGAVAALWVGAFQAHAGSDKLLLRRAEAQTLIENIAAGDGVQAAANRLAYLGEQAYAARALTGMLHEAIEPRQRYHLVYGLSLLATPAVERTFLSLLKDPDGAIRMAAVQGLGHIKSKNTTALLPLLADQTLGVRREAARALGGTKNPRVGKALLAAARVEGEPEVRAAMILAVGRSGDKRQAKGLTELLQHSSESTRHAAAQALVLLSHRAGLAFAEKLLRSEDRFERRQGLSIFEGTPAKVSARYLRPLLSDPDKNLAALAARILYEGGESSMLEWLVLSSHRAPVAHKLAFEEQLERLRLTDEQRRKMLRSAGLLR